MNLRPFPSQVLKPRQPKASPLIHVNIAVKEVFRENGVIEQSQRERILKHVGREFIQVNKLVGTNIVYPHQNLSMYLDTLRAFMHPPSKLRGGPSGPQSSSRPSTAFSDAHHPPSKTVSRKEVDPPPAQLVIKQEIIPAIPDEIPIEEPSMEATKIKPQQESVENKVPQTKEASKATETQPTPAPPVVLIPQTTTKGQTSPAPYSKEGEKGDKETEEQSQRLYNNRPQDPPPPKPPPNLIL